jgi:integrase
MNTAVRSPAAQEAPVSRPVPAIDGVAGSITLTGTLIELIDGYVENLRARKKAADTLAKWRHTLVSQSRMAGWNEPADMAGTAVEDWLLAQSQAKGWKGATVRAYAAAWRGFTRWAAKRGHFPTDPMLTMESQKIEDPGLGARAATTDEARALLAVTTAMERQDGRACPRLAYFAMLFLAGLRSCEPGRLLWSDLRLNDPIPHVVWRAETQKNRRRAVLALAPELVSVLRRHCQSAKSDNQFTLADNAPIFPRVPNRRTFTIDAERAGITIQDRDGANLSFHSARKWFSTTLTNAGVAARMVDHLMRHTGSVESRYFRPTLEEQAAALYFLPPLGLVIQGLVRTPPKNDDNRCRQGATAGDTQGAKSEIYPVHPTQETLSLHRRNAGRPTSQSDTQSDGAGSSFSAEQVSPLASNSLTGQASQPANRGYKAGSADQTIRSLIAANRAMLDAMESLLREEHADGSHP